jgi:probable LLM family oxidoreductase
MKTFELGITTFAEVMPDLKTGNTISYDERIDQIVDEIVLADRVGLHYYGIGEHHRKDFAASSPHTILAAATRLTQNIKLGSAVTVLSSEDPVRVYQNFATLNALSKGRAEIMAGRGSFIESFPLFGYDLSQYDRLFSEKLDLLLQIRDHEIVSYEGKTRAAIDNLGVYPRTNYPLPIHIAVGGTPASVVRAANYGLPLFLAIIGGYPRQFLPLIELYKKTYQARGFDLNNQCISVHSHGFIADTMEEAVEIYFPSIKQAMDIIGKERGWPTYTRQTYDASRSIEGALFVGDPEYVARKILHLRKTLGIHRFALHVPVGQLDHDQVMKTIELLGTKVKPIIDQAIALENRS